ncbi:TetR/AcrR family transcriptional regulator [Pontibacterium granulatum]|uniref:TetR/AcrR family transcriptional regulator n=1 Tax=Pontibacterium granulatum TaxID=2036029 RepID=UPI00249AD028|nr:TetR/AcrR family transcriptional regulator [Pontibacterium granulatum]MDI3324883.1 TetR/AcrR family transcriptional regulator [Pontibacterium granulatum]
MAKIRERNRELIIEVASKFFAEKGFAATKTIDIANSAGLPKANVYYYFKTKQNLYRSVLESITEPLLQASEPFYENDDPATALEEYIRAKIRISQTHPHASKVFASEIMHGAPHLPEDIAAQMQDQTKQMCERIQSWIDQDLMAAVPPQHLLFTIWASTQTYADFDWQISQITGKEKLDQEDYDQAADLIVKLVLSGCGIQVGTKEKETA